MSVIQPDPQVWPECSECGFAYVLRRCMRFTIGAGEQANNLRLEWLWQRDCKHKRANVEIATKEPTP